MSEEKENDKLFDPHLYEAELKSACTKAKSERADPHAKIMLSECEPLRAVFLAAMKEFPDRVVEVVNITIQFALFAILDEDLESVGIVQFQEAIYDAARQAGLRMHFQSV